MVCVCTTVEVKLQGRPGETNHFGWKGVESESESETDPRERFWRGIVEPRVLPYGRLRSRSVTDYVKPTNRVV